jgi:hypothetical protein
VKYLASGQLPAKNPLGDKIAKKKKEGKRKFHEK